jgi:hypothetical protein
VSRWCHLRRNPRSLPDKRERDLEHWAMVARLPEGCVSRVKRELPKIFPSHDAAEVLLRRQKGSPRPTHDHGCVAPTANVPRGHARARLRALDQVRHGQAAMQRRRNAQPRAVSSPIWEDSLSLNDDLALSDEIDFSALGTQGHRCKYCTSTVLHIDRVGKFRITNGIVRSTPYR